jgi:hypothetical protein
MEEIDLKGVGDLSRNGPVLRFPEPVALHYEKPLERVCFCPVRDANPFFHLMESLWMLAKRDDVAFPTFYNSHMSAFSDDGERYNAAYGFRMRRHFGKDQLAEVVRELKENPASRQAVIALWDPEDLGKTTKDKACNLSLVFEIDRDRRLNLTVFNRSNDAVLGAVAGANPVHMSYFQQYVADALGVEVGWYEQVSNNLHAYQEHPKTQRLFFETGSCDRYPLAGSAPRLLDLPMTDWDDEVEMFCAEAGDDDLISQVGWRSKFIRTVAIPVHNTFVLRKSVGAISWLAEIRDEAWRIACGEWIERRAAK